MDRIFLFITCIGLAALSVFFWLQNGQLQEDIDEVKSLHDIAITSTLLTETTEFTFMKISNEYVYLMDQKGKALAKATAMKVSKSARWKALYKWRYNFHFGFYVKQGWQWCIKVDQAKGEVTLNAPLVTQLNTSDASPKLMEILNGGVRKTQLAADKWIQLHANKAIKKTADVYLQNATVQSSVQKSLATFFQDILNDAHPDANPVRKVVVNSVAHSQCDDG
ncbi:hypothetical protein [Motilimonas pumila]|uniref:DUF4230 domain-containing protein n=1 Tax=Motilimonas pumila TaxID=2303987 RepID=A0A418YK38_9GAMM|nr:hypothetical protein [Motilimonas pumila]RJG51329.1 hypothetical protein D1Z90_00930 [Motilimonas pumila]